MMENCPAATIFRFLTIVVVFSNLGFIFCQLNCDFENPNNCKWTQYKKDKFDWTRKSGKTQSANTGPTTDHTSSVKKIPVYTTGGNAKGAQCNFPFIYNKRKYTSCTTKGGFRSWCATVPNYDKKKTWGYCLPVGYYMFIETSNPRKKGDNAILLSPQIPSGPKCLKLWYHMYGPHIDTLAFHIFQNNNFTKLYQIKGSQGNRWKSMNFTYTSATPFQIALEGIRGVNYQGDISIDDIEVADGSCTTGGTDGTGGNSTSYGLCTFEKNKCGFKDDPTNNFNWIRYKGATPSRNTGPNTDHTLKTRQGYYMYVEASNKKSRSKGRLSKTFNNLQATGSCLEFYYHMFGYHQGTLNVYINPPVTGVAKPQFSVGGQQGRLWIKGEVSINTTTALIVFEGITRYGYQGDMALDDILLKPGLCPKPGECNFQVDFCTWYNAPISAGLDDFDWIVGSGGTPSRFTGPTADRNGDLKGKYLFIETSGKRTGQKARLYSELFNSTGKGNCFIFYYHMYGRQLGALNIYVNDTSGKETLIWKQTQNLGKKWQNGQVDVEVPGSYKVIVEGVRGRGYSGDIGIDDFSFKPGKCSILPTNAKPTTTATTMKPTTKVPTKPPTPIFNCNFEFGICSDWKQDKKTDQLDWTLASGSTGSSGTGPAFDHTKKNRNGKYIYLEVSRQKLNNTARLISTNIPATSNNGGKCLTFWYHMYGPHVNTLNIYVLLHGKVGMPVWTRTGTQGNRWNKGQVTLVSGQPFQAVIEASVGISYRGDIAIDDISLSTKPCVQPSTTCTFERITICGYIHDTASDINFQWTRQSQYSSSARTGPKNDHTLQSSSGFYMYTEASKRRQGDIARLVSPVNDATQGSCLEFWYHMYGLQMGTLSVLLKIANKLQTAPIWSETGNKGNVWKVATMTIKSSDTYQIAFQGKIGRGYQSDMAIDDVKLTPGPCKSPGFCDFETGLCTYTNLKTDNFDWLVGSANTPSRFTGPKFDHTLGNSSGSYVFLETSRTRNGQSAVLSSQQFNAVTGRRKCLNFWYHMYGSNIGTLQVIYKVFSGSQPERVIWNLTGQQQISESDPWKPARVPVDMNADHVIMFKGISSGGYRGDMAIDDIQFTSLACALSPPEADPNGKPTAKPSTTYARTRPPTLAPSSDNCNFETDFCALKPDSSAHFNWTRRQGFTDSSGTGPSTDHTFGKGAVQRKGPGSLQHAGGKCVHVLNGAWTKPKDNQPIVLYDGCGQERLEFQLTNDGLLKLTKWNMCVAIANSATSSGSKVVVSDTCTSKWQYLSNDVLQNVATGMCLSPYRGSYYPSNNSPLVVYKDCKTKSRFFHFTPTMGYYAYIETSYPRKPNDTARLISPSYSGQKCLTFWYHMYGPNVNQLNVYVKNEKGPYPAPIWSKYGSHGDTWKVSHVTMTYKGSYVYVIEALRGNGYRGDIAIDDVVVTDNCPAPLECSFEEKAPKFCGWTNLKSKADDDFDWSLGKGSTSSKFTGPSNDHTYGDSKGQYLFIETSGRIRPNSKARLQSPVYNGNSKTSGQCFQFWYHMYGSSIGSLNLYIKRPGQPLGRAKWTKKGNKGNRWMIGQLNVVSQGQYQLIFEGIRGRSYTGDIAIDDFKMHDGPCNNLATCDFENEKCTWRNTRIEDTFDWIVGSGTTLTRWTGPVTDHSLNTGAGHYIFIDASGKKAGEKARLNSELIGAHFIPFLPYCVRFWYHMKGSSIGTLNLIMKSGPSKSQEKILWTLSGNQANVWREGTVPVYNNQDYLLVFEAITGGGARGDIALDDIVYSIGRCVVQPAEADPKYVSTTPVPTGPPTTPSHTIYDCDFEGKNFCQWTQDITDKFNWTLNTGSTGSTRTGPTVDHTKGNATGTYAYIETSWPRKDGDNARILSPNLPADKDHGHPHCLKFWYHMYGAHIESLNVYKKVGGTLQKIWSRVGDNGDFWKYAQVDLTSKSNFQVAIEAVRGNDYRGDISIDDIEITDGSCPPPAFCDFEHDMCKYESDPSADFDWTRHKGETPSVTTGPKFDHTLQTDKGYYVYTEASGRRKLGDKARLVGDVIKHNKPMCLEFWFNMNGFHIGTLNVYVKTSSGKSLIWQRKGNHGKQWKIGRTTIRPRDGRQIVFEGVRGRSFSGDIAVDDIKTIDGYCPPPGDCSFETGFCSWSNVKNSNFDQFDWILGSGATLLGTNEPDMDHTTGTKQGKFAYVVAYQQGSGDLAWLISEDFYPTLGRCIEFWGYMSGAGIGDLNVYIRNQNGTNRRIWTLSGQQGTTPQWFQGQAPIRSTVEYQIVFEVQLGGSSKGVISIDDVIFTNFPCKNIPTGSVPPDPTTPVPTTPPTTAAPTPAPNTYTCNFTYGICNWMHDTTAKFNWTRHQGSTSSFNTGPKVDHTDGASGWYIFLETSWPRKENDTARIMSPKVPATSQMCLQFWYHMYGDHIGNLTVYQKVGTTMTALWQKRGTLGPRWRHGTVDVSSASSFQIVFEGMKGAGYRGDIALDDLSLNDGACPPSAECTFEDPKLCGWTNMVGDNFDWTRDNAGTSSRGTGPRTDHTYGTALGYYMYIESSRPQSQGHKAWLKSADYTPTLGRCLSFWYHMYGSHIGELNVLIYQNGSRSAPIWQLKGNQGSEWRPSRVTIKSPVAHAIIFEGRTGASYRGDIAIDDVMITEGPCADPGNCDFERDLCGYTNSPYFDDFDWQIGTGTTSSVTTGPKTDHSTSTALGRYIFIESSWPRQIHEIAIISSETIPVKGTGKCLQFWYHMYGTDIGTLEVNMNVANYISETIVWQLKGNQGSRWMQGQAPLLSRGQNMQVKFEGIRGNGYKGDIAIDDVTVVDYSGSCPVLPKAARPWGCNFELGLCDWKQSRLDDFDWKLNKGHTGSSGTGPSVDHTTNTTNGYYLYIETSAPRKANDSAKLVSPTIRGNGTKQTYCMWFAYHMYGPHVNTLKVYTYSQGAYRPALWQRKGSRGPKWNHAEVQVTVLQDTQVYIEGVRGASFKGDIAIDDLDIWYGDCFSSGICTFEGADICYWYAPKVRNFYWQRAAGSTPSVKTGPKVDHTYGTPYGHYMYIETSSASVGAKAYMYSPWYYNTGQRCVQFFYHMYGKDIGQLDVFIRYANSRYLYRMFSRKGNQNNTWHQGQADVKRSKVYFQIVVRGSKGGGYQGDIAVDDFRIRDGACPALGDCDFEHIDFCSWMQEGGKTDDFDWIIGTGSTNSYFTGPKIDHTTQSNGGYYAFIETSAPRQKGDKAMLKSIEFQPTTGSGKCFKFWYHMYGASIGTLNVYVRETNGGTPVKTNIMWTMSGNQGRNWQQGTFTINVKTTHQVVFEAIRGSSYTGDIALDDLEFTVGSCAFFPKTAWPAGRSTPTPTPLVTTLGPTIGNTGFDCNFDKDFCKSWTTNSTRSKFVWKRHQGSTSSAGTGPHSDHTTNSDQGYYVYIETSYPARFNDTAWLIGKNIPNPSGQCLSFWYHMHGPHVGSLNVYLVTSKDTQLRFMRQGTQGDKWKHGQFYIDRNSGSQVTIRFEGVRGKGYAGDIALDDISFRQGNCPPERECTFENVQSGSGSSLLCNWQQETSKDDFDWSIGSAATPSVKTGPRFDHTLKTKSGHYVYIETSYPRKFGQKAIMISLQYRATQGQCFTFWYHMYGATIGNLTLLQRIDNIDTPLWTRTQNEGNIWRPALVSVRSRTKPFNLLFQGTVGRSYTGDIAIDDILLVDGRCPAPGNCDFEDLMTCSYIQDTFEDDFDWIRGNGGTGSWRTGPSIDNTKKDSTGHYYYIEASAPRKTGDKARLVSELFDPTSRSYGRCLQFYRHMYGTSIGTFNVYVKTGPGNGSDAEQLVWTDSGNQGNSWIQSQVPIFSRKPFRLVFEAVRGNGYKGDIAIDDVNFNNNFYPCSYIPAGAAPPTLPPTTITPADSNCTFDSNTLCRWKQVKDGSDDFDWTMKKGRTGSTGTGPLGDHTSGKGTYIFIEASYPRKVNDTAVIRSPPIRPTLGAVCFRFSYHMHGAHVNTLNIYKVIGGKRRKIWKRVGTQGNQWRDGRVNIRGVKGVFNIEIEGIRGTSYQGDISLDDFVLTNGKCGPPKYCDFENNQCGWKNVLKGKKFNWLRGNGGTPSKGTGPKTDHTTGVDLGTYLYIETSWPRRYKDNAIIRSRKYPANRKGYCFNFWYHMYGYHIGALNIYLNSAKTPPIWNKTDSQGNAWKHGRVTIATPTSFTILIEGVVGKSYSGDIAIDDVWIDDLPCPAPGACDFESQSFCTWNQVPNKANKTGYDDFDWELGSGSTPSYGTGPSVDHTKGTALGTYAYIEVSGTLKNGQKAQLISESFSATNGRCLSFWYHMYGYGVGDLNIYISDPTLKTPHLIKSISGSQGNQWIQGEIGLHWPRSFSVIIEAQKGTSYRGDISIDDINIKDGNCVGLCSSVQPTARVACGSGSVTAATCVVSYGCCYDSSVPNVPFCFQHPASCAAVPTIARQQCGYKGISKYFCSRKGCCYDTTASKGPRCYYSLSQPTQPPPTTPPPTTPPPSPFDCDFETNQCRYTNLRNDQFNWKRHKGSTASWGTGPKFDHTLGDQNGYYMYVETSYNKPNDTANLATPLIDFPIGGDNICVHFYYHMYGQHVGNFNVYHMLGSKLPAAPLWKRSGALVDKWTYAQIVLPRRPAFKLVFQGVRGKGYQGDIAIDDVAFVNGNCPPTVNCGFENGKTLCGWKQDASDDFDWSIGYGNTTSYATGPKWDHTYETGYGHYLYIEGSYPRQPGDKARIESFINQPTKGTCVEFYYHMRGSGIGTLNVWVRRGNTIDSKPLWTISGEQGNEWYRNKITVKEDQQQWTIIMEGIRGADFNSDIALDDIHFYQGECAPRGDCDFEKNMDACGYENDPKNKVDWLIYSGSTPSYNTGPSVDHTLGTKQGHYLYIEASSPAQKGDLGRIYSEEFKVNPNFKWCVDFWYHMFGNGAGALRVRMKYRTRWSKGRYYYRTLWSQEGNHDDVWLNGQANITASYDFQIVFEAEVGSGMTHESDIAVDDIIVREGLCKPPPPPPKPDPCKRKCYDGTCIPSNKVCDFFPDCAQNGNATDNSDEDGCDSCDFETGWCDWNDTSKGLFNWRRLRGGTASYNTGPKTDHTKGTSLGYYVYVEASNGKSSDLASLRSPPINQAAATCTLTFWYHMYGTSIGDLSVYLINGYRLTEKWRLTGNQGNQWQKGTVYINRQTRPFAIKFVAERGYSYRGDIAIDDIKLTDCALPKPAKYCNGRYAHICTKTRACVSYSRKCDFTDDCGDNSDEENCRWREYPYRCNFEYSKCYWRDLKDGQFKWTRHRGYTDSFNTGPSFDHTTGTTSGYYLYAEASYPRRRGDVARIGSGYIDATQRGYCMLRFYYHLYGDHIGKLSVKTRQCKSCPENLVWSRNDSVGNYWVRHALYLYSKKPFQVILEAEIGSGFAGDIAVDDISFDGCYDYRGIFPSAFPTTTTATTTNVCGFGKIYCSKDSKCIKDSKRCDFNNDCSDGEDEIGCGSCTFEKDMCRYKDISTGRIEFTRSQPLTDGSGGPSVDHTTGTAKGYFALINSGTGSRYAQAALLSPILSASAESCKLRVYYYGAKGYNWLKIQFKQPGKNNKIVTSTMLSQSIKKINQWQNTTVHMGQRPAGWQIKINAQDQYAAIDDIQLIDCAFPPKLGVCVRTKIGCDNGACIDPSQMCDFTNHCGDNSDEKPGVCKNYKERCNFETDLCNWYQDQSDDFDWTRSKGHTSSSGTGSGVDHTIGTAEGYYLYIETSSPRKPNDTARIMSTVFRGSAKTCTMRFYYHMFGAHVDTLSVKLRLSQDYNSTMKTVWTKQGNQGPSWNSAIVNIRSKVNFQIVIEGRRGKSFKGDISIDDISFTPDCQPDFKATLNPLPITPSPPPGCKPGQFSCGDGQCIPSENFCNFKSDCRNGADEIRCPSSCDFEGGKSCNWFNAKFGDIMDWTVHQGKTPSNGTGPPYDHTKGTKDGWYVYMEAGQRKGSNFPNAHYISPMYYQGAYICKFSFWYNMYHYKISVNNDARLNVLYRRNGKDTKLWSSSRTTGDKWVQATIDLPHCPRDFRLLFEGHHYWLTKTDAAIDDLKFTCAEPPVTTCGATDFTCTKTKQCVPKDSICDLDRNCCDDSDEEATLCKGYTRQDFELGFQKWIQFDNDDFDFDLQSGKTSSSGTGPKTDHTLQEEHGKYIYIEASIRQENETATVGSPTIGPTSSDCKVRFWYHMYGAHIGTLTVYTATTYGVPETSVFTKSGDQGDGWKQGVALLSSNKDFQVIFEAKMGTSYKGDISLDDITFTPGCKFNNNVLPGGPTPPPVDPCLPDFQCVLSGACIPRSQVCDFIEDCPGGTDESNVTCGYPQGFENGFGAWKNAHFESYDFKLQKGRTPSFQTGPTTDARGDKNGYYAYLEVSKRQRNKKAVLSSPVYAGAYAHCVVNFYYHMFGRNTGILRLDLVEFYPTVDMPQYTTLFELRGDQGNKWVKNRVSIGRRYEPFFLNFTATVGGGVRGDIAIDEISFENCAHPPPCQVVQPGQFICQNNRCINDTEVCNFVDDCGDTSDEAVDGICNDYLGCNFEYDQDPCNFTQVKDKSRDDFDWKLNSGWTPSYNTGPTRDHTFGTSEGHYMYIEASGRKKGDKAQLMSLPVLSKPGGNCQLKFFYHMSGKHVNDLNIYLYFESKNTYVFMKSATGDFGDMWREFNVDLSDQKGIYRIVFEGVVGDSFRSDIAIDDIILNPDCLHNSTGFSTRQPCREDQFVCKSIYQCLSNTTRCNGNVDCRDGSDEDGCEGPVTGQSTADKKKTSIYASAIVGAIVLILIIVIVAYIVIKRRKEKKLQLFSVFYDPSKQPENEKKNGKNKEISMKSNEGVSNPVYDEQPMGEFSMGELDTDMFTDEAFAVETNVKAGATSMANPLYQDPYMEDDDSPLSNF